MADQTIHLGDSPASLASGLGAASAPAVATPEYQRVLSMTAELFPGPIEVREEIDPDIAGNHCLVLRVVAKGAFDDIMARDRQWHRKIASKALRLTRAYALSIDVQE